jgi:uncharacterized protein (DUF1697 family)
MRLRDVATFINSGNVIFRSSEDPVRLEKKIEKKLLAEHALATRAILRSMDEMEALLAAFPRGFGTKAGFKHYVMFLGRAVDRADVLVDVAPNPSLESVVYVPGALLWSVAEKTSQKSTLTKISRKPLSQEVTVRNPNTTRKVTELLRKLHDA